MNRYSALAARVQAHVGQSHRYAHTVRVARCAELLAMVHGASTEQARTAGMLHDLARLYSAERLLKECAARSMGIDAFERANPIVLHARLGAALAREEFGVEDPAVLSAIEKHTVASGAMSLLDCIVYLADGLEPDRRFPERDELWEIAQRDIAAAMRGTLQSTISFLKKRGNDVSPQTLEAAKTFHAVLEEAQPSLN